MTYKCHFRTRCGKFAAPSAPSAETFLDNFLLFSFWNNVYYMYFFTKLLFLQKVLQKPYSYIVKNGFLKFSHAAPLSTK